MVETLKIEVERVAKSRLPQVDFSNLPFGKIYTDHMFMADFRNGEWGNARIVPYGHMLISPSTPALHYGQSIFEGLKAYRGTDREALVFRPMANFKRLNLSAERLCMAQVPEELFMEGMRAVLDIDRAWIPSTPGSALYIRPFLFSADEFIGIRPSLDFTFMIIASPVGAYYSAPVKVKIETHYTRAVAGGTGYAKAGGNYGGAIYPTKLAMDQGYQQLLWTDGKEHAYIEESGTMNVMFVFGDTLVTPALSDSILAGITRDSVLAVARREGMKVEERKIGVKELIDGLKSGLVKEAFGVGTAATIAPIQAIGHEGIDYPLPAASKQNFAAHIYTVLDEIKRGIAPDPFGWVVKM